MRRRDARLGYGEAGVHWVPRETLGARPERKPALATGGASGASTGASKASAT